MRTSVRVEEDDKSDTDKSWCCCGSVAVGVAVMVLCSRWSWL